MFPIWLLEILAQDAPPAGDGNPEGVAAPGIGNFLWPMVIIFFIFYMLVFRPEGKKRKERQRKVTQVEKGDWVMTNGGLIAKVWKVDEREIILHVDRDKDVRARYAKNAIFDVWKDEKVPGSKSPNEESIRQFEQRQR